MQDEATLQDPEAQVEEDLELLEAEEWERGRAAAILRARAQHGEPMTFAEMRAGAHWQDRYVWAEQDYERLRSPRPRPRITPRPSARAPRRRRRQARGRRLARAPDAEPEPPWHQVARWIACDLTAVAR